MAEDPIILAPIVHNLAEQQAAEQFQQSQHRLTTPEELQASDQLFTRQEREQQFVSGLLGMYTGTILLRDLVAEHLARDQKEELEEQNQREIELPDEE